MLWLRLTSDSAHHRGYWDLPTCAQCLCLCTWKMVSKLQLLMPFCLLFKHSWLIRGGWKGIGRQCILTKTFSSNVPLSGFVDSCVCSSCWRQPSMPSSTSSTMWKENWMGNVQKMVSFLVVGFAFWVVTVCKFVNTAFVTSNNHHRFGSEHMLQSAILLSTLNWYIPTIWNILHLIVLLVHKVACIAVFFLDRCIITSSGASLLLFPFDLGHTVSLQCHKQSILQLNIICTVIMRWIYIGLVAEKSQLYIGVYWMISTIWNQITSVTKDTNWSLKRCWPLPQYMPVLQAIMDFVE